MDVYKSKIGYTLISIVTLSGLGLLLLAYIKKSPPIMFWLFAGFTLLFLSYSIYLNLATKYCIYKTTLIVKCGILYKKVLDINTIKSISRTSVLLAAPAPSYNRIALSYGKFETLVISPKNKVEFAKTLSKINPKIINTIK